MQCIWGNSLMGRDMAKELCAIKMAASMKAIGIWISEVVKALNDIRTEILTLEIF